MATDDELPRSNEPLRISVRVTVPPDAMRLQFARSAGPGGQNVNKLNTKAELWTRLDAIDGLDPESLDRLKQMAGKRLTRDGELHLVSQTERSQEDNRRLVLQRLAQMIRSALRPPRKRKPTKPTRASKKRRLDAKKQTGDKKASRRPPKLGE